MTEYETTRYAILAEYDDVDSLIAAAEKVREKFAQ